MPFRTSTYQEFEDGSRALIGVDTLIDTEKTFLNAYFNKHIRMAWEKIQWAELTLTEERTPDANNIVGWEQAGETAVGLFYNIYKTDPCANQFPEELGFQVQGDGAKLIAFDSTATSTVFVRFQERVPTYSTLETQTFPYIFLPYMIHICYSDWLQAEGQHEKAQLALMEADAIIDFEVEKQERQQNQTINTRWLTHGTQQYRI